jgi:hypothetical protein
LFTRLPREDLSPRLKSRRNSVKLLVLRLDSPAVGTTTTMMACQCGCCVPIDDPGIRGGAVRAGGGYHDRDNRKIIAVRA